MFTGRGRSALRLLRWLCVFNTRVWLSRFRLGRPLVIDGGWWDLVVDPLAFGIEPDALVVARLAAPLAARADVALCVTTDHPDLLGSTRFNPRTPAYQDRWWRQVLPRLGRATVTAEVDRLDAAVTDLLSGGSVATGGRDAAWRAVPIAPPRRELTTTERSGLAARALWRPMHRGMAAAARLNGPLLRHGLTLPTAAPVDGLADLCGRIGVGSDGIAAMQSHSGGRVVLAAVDRGTVSAFVKIGPRGDDGLRGEAEMLARLAGRTRSFSVPVVLFAGEWRAWFVLATAAVEHDSQPRRVSVGDALEICIELGRGVEGTGPLMHGDFAPWNVLVSPSTRVVIDWERASTDFEPLADLCMFISRRGAVLRHQSPADAVEELVRPGRAGWRYLRTLGIDAALAPHLLAERLACPSPEPRVRAYEAAMRAHLHA